MEYLKFVKVLPKPQYLFQYLYLIKRIRPVLCYRNKDVISLSQRTGLLYLSSTWMLQTCWLGNWWYLIIKSLNIVKTKKNVAIGKKLKWNGEVKHVKLCNFRLPEQMKCRNFAVGHAWLSSHLFLSILQVLIIFCCDCMKCG